MKLIDQQIYDIPFLTVDAWQAQGIEHGFLGRALDFPKDREKFENIFQKQLLLLKQTHSNDFVEIDSKTDIRQDLEADAWIVKVGSFDNALFGIKTADCVPILINTLDDTYRAAVHCGWRGAVGGLLSRLLERLFVLGVARSSIQLAFGPSALACCYEVGADVVNAVEQAVKNLKVNSSIKPIVENKGRFYADIQSLLLMQLLSLGLSKDQIILNTICTISTSDYFSYRREKDQAGRQLSFIQC